MLGANLVPRERVKKHIHRSNQCRMGAAKVRTEFEELNGDMALCQRTHPFIDNLVAASTLVMITSFTNETPNSVDLTCHTHSLVLGGFRS